MSTKKIYKILEDDIFLTAYPKSGNNFLLFLTAELLHRKKIDWATKGDIVQNVADVPINNLPSPHLVWSHESFDPTYPKVIYLVRDPRDVVISYYYHHLKYTGEKIQFNEFFDRFLKGNIWPGRWDFNIGSWLDNQQKVKNGFLLIKYEDLLKNTTKEAYRITSFLNLNRTGQEINEAVNWASFDNMKTLEKKQKVHLDGDSEFVDRTMSFLREGQSNSWKSVLNNEQQQQINQTFNNTLTRLGYK